jgi:PAS domain S-box-containing protein
MRSDDDAGYATFPEHQDASEAELRATLESMTIGDADAILSQLAGALFPGGIADLAQLTWTDGRPPAAAGATRAPLDADAKLRTAELRYRTLIEQIPAVTFMAVLGEGDNEVYVSPHIEALLGFTQAEWLENPFLWYTQLHPDDHEIWHREFARGCRTGGPFRAECRFLARDGRVVWVRGEARLVKDELGRPLFLQGVAFDITEAKRAEALVLREAVRTTEQRYRDLVEQLGAIFWEAEIDRPGFTFVSRGAERILGYPPERWLADPDFWLSLVHVDDRAAAAAALSSAHERRNAVEEFEFRALGADGRTVWLHQKVYAHRSKEGQGRLLGVILDITDRKRAEQILRDNEARLRTEAGIRRTLHRIGSALASELEIERVVQLATDEATTLTGAAFGAFFYNVINDEGESYTLYTLSGASRDAFAHFPMPRNTAVFGPTFRGEGVVRLDDVTQDPRFGKNAPYRGLPEGHLPVRSYLAVPVISRSSEVLGGIFFGHPQPGQFTDEHERLAAGIAGWTAVAIDNARLFRAAEKARASAETANRAKDEFLATMSHELRTPLNAVLGWTMILRSNGGDEAMRRRALDTIERNARAQAQIIEDLLDVSRIVTGKLILEPAAVNLATVIESAVDGIRLAADTKRLDIRRRLDLSASVVSGDPTRLLQVVSNLLTNAVKFTPAGGWIEVRLERRDGLARLSVADDGQGISAEFLPHVFERFRQADGSTTRAYGGLGLGLAIVRHLVDLHGGTVQVASPGAGRGSTFTVEIPLMQAAPAETTFPSSLRDVGPMERSLDGVRVMVVDDDADSRDLMTHLLERAGAAVTTLASAAAVLEKIDAVAPHVLISDIGMPDHDGYELIRLLRTLGSSCANVPAIAVTAYAGPGDRARAMEAGFQLHMPKPISPRELIANVERLAMSDR